MAHTSESLSYKREKTMNPPGQVVTLEVPLGAVKWVRWLLAFYASTRYGSCEFHKGRDSNSIDKFAPRMFHHQEDEVLAL